MTRVATDAEMAQAIEDSFVAMITNPVLERGLRLVDFSKLLKRNRPADSEEPLSGDKENQMASFEDIIAAFKSHETAMIAHTKALLGMGGKAAAAPAAAAPAPAAKPAKAAAGKHTMAEAQVVMNALKEKFGIEVAKDIRNEFGKVTKMSDLVDPAAIDALFEAGTKKLAEETAETADEGDGL